MLGIGENGHIGFNEPGSVLDGKTSEVPLVSSTIKANSRFFEKEEDVPKKLSPWVLVLFPKRGKFCSLLLKKQSTRRKVHAGRPRNEFLSGFIILTMFYRLQIQKQTSKNANDFNYPLIWKICVDLG
ncbi:hypothetical protein [Alkalicoccus saliphilus]|uniref:Glucosamine/galactosamine-6-phosphate isomerase domain-containing protein n=1 Tax=Alkalicoccus saliphilus TaxID=200989 RepID=A0A2T4U5C8_9BACI|nr:hypothetical protein [Alkalicoccus saliphilus]PTL38600.1 hypothetical protein C6Y45_10465 [Alkalicoccus saliphilus]